MELISLSITERVFLQTEIEISEDMYIITAEEAKKHIEPPKLTSIVISPRRHPN